MRSSRVPDAAWALLGVVSILYAVMGVALTLLGGVQVPYLTFATLVSFCVGTTIAVLEALSPARGDHHSWRDS